jgi:hypothetical protein
MKKAPINPEKTALIMTMLLETQASSSQFHRGINGVITGGRLMDKSMLYKPRPTNRAKKTATKVDKQTVPKIRPTIQVAFFAIKTAALNNRPKIMMGKTPTIRPFMDILVAYKPDFNPMGKRCPQTRMLAIRPNKIKGILLDNVLNKDMAIFAGGLYRNNVLFF